MSRATTQVQMVDILTQLHVSGDWKNDGIPFRRKARARASLYRRDLAIDAAYTAPPPTGRPCGSWIGHPDLDAALAANLLQDETVLSVAKEYLDGGSAREPGALVLSTRERRINLCGSQPMCFNLFSHWRRDRELATRHARQLWPGRVDRILAVHFEHSPGRGNPRFLGNKSAFDVALAHTTPDGGKGLIGIETKYFEDMREKPKGEGWKERYGEIATKAMCFRSAAVRTDLWSAPVWQLWLDHLLVLSALLAGDNGASIRNRDPPQPDDGFWRRQWDTVLAVVLFPAENTFVRHAVATYRSHLNCDGLASHEARTLSEFVQTMRRIDDSVWLRAFEDRYLDFSAVDALGVSGW